MTSESHIASTKRAWVLPALCLLTGICATCFALRQTALEWTPAAERAHTGSGAVAAWGFVSLVTLLGFCLSRWRLWWAKVPLLALFILSAFWRADLLVRYAAFGK